MTEADLYSALGEIFSEVFLRDDIILRPETTASEIKGWDSFKQIEIIMAVEERFGIKLPTKDIDDLKNVGDLVSAINKRVA